jgi:predicted Zn-dependent protease
MDFDVAIKLTRLWRLTQPRAGAAALALICMSCASELAGDRLPVSVDAQQSAPASPANQREHTRILAAYGGAYEHPQLETLLAQTADRLVAASERPDIKYKITILNSPAINAFALATGQLYVTRGLIALANDTSELASVLSHEMAHVIARHAAFREDQARQAVIFSRVASDLLGDSQLGALALARSRIALASFSRAQEFEADGIGVGISARSGYDPYGAQRFLTSMGLNGQFNARRTQNDQRPPDFFSSHPATPDRVDNARANARQYAGPGARKSDRGEYLALLDGLAYGDDPSEGFVRGRSFIHPRLGFTFNAPDGFMLDNTAQAVFGVKDGGQQAFRLDVVRERPEAGLSEYLKSGWFENIDLNTISENEINGMAAATAIARKGEWTFRLYVVRFESDIYRFIFASKIAFDATDRDYRESIATFRRINAAEALAIKPLRIRVVKVSAATTIENLARRHAIPDRPLERLRVLNGLGPGDKIKPGDIIKIVVQ